MDRDGGILVACDSLQNLVTPDKYFSDQSRQMMREMGFFQLANFGPVWVQVNEPKAWDFVLPHLQTLAACRSRLGRGFVFVSRYWAAERRQGVLRRSHLLTEVCCGADRAAPGAWGLR
jgi:hypothetical protein